MKFRTGDAVTWAPPEDREDLYEEARRAYFGLILDDRLGPSRYRIYFLWKGNGGQMFSGICDYGYDRLRLLAPRDGIRD